MSEAVIARKVAPCLLAGKRQKERYQAAPHDLTGNRVIITSRIVGYPFEPLRQLPHYIVEEMDEQAITTFCRLWVQQGVNTPATGEEMKEQAEQLRAVTFSQTHPGVRLMAGNPLLLALIAQVYWSMRSSDGSHVLPVRRVRLFEAVRRTFYDRRDIFWSQAGITLQRLSLALGAVAVELQAGTTAGLATEAEVRRLLSTVLTDQKQVEAVLTAARDVSGFLVARGEGIYGFLHRAVQEYCAAEHLVSQSEQAITNVVSHALDPVWREPVVLAFGLLGRHGVTRLARAKPPLSCEAASQARSFMG